MRNINLVETLREEFKTIQMGHASSSDFWGGHRENLHKLINSGADPNFFFQWHPINFTMYCGVTGYASNEIGYLQSLPDWDDRWRPAITELGEFEMPRYPYYSDSTATTIHHAYHLSMFEEKIKTHINEMDFIFEFGGGYGDTCRIIHRLGFKGNYIICDLPELLAIQRFFLEASGIQVSTGKVELVNDIAKILAHIPSVDKKCVISTWAIEESIPKIIDNFISIMPQFNHFLFAMGGDACFPEIKNTLNNVGWHKWEIPFLKGHQYMMGKQYAY